MPKSFELLVFELNGSMYAVELGHVREVVPAVFVTPLPAAPPVVEGVIDVRGELAAVYDLRARFRLPPRPLGPDEKMVVAWTGERLVAFRCDATRWIRNVEREAIASAEPLPGDGRYVAGAARIEDGLVLIHDLKTFLDEAERATLDSALQQQGVPA